MTQVDKISIYTCTLIVEVVIVITPRHLRKNKMQPHIVNKWVYVIPARRYVCFISNQTTFLVSSF